MRNICDIVNNKMCMSCGACSSVCPVEAIEMVYMKQEGFFRPSVNANKCVDCGKCRKVCPAEHQEKSSLMGEFKTLYLAHATDSNIRHWATSGGVVNALAHYLLDKEIVESVLMTGYSEDSPVESRPYLLTSKNISILTCNPRYFASRYVTVPVLEKIKDVKNMTSIAVVGTSCQIRALNHIVCGGGYDLNVLKIGITCSGGMSYLATTEFKRMRNAPMAKMFYRGDGWPGKNSLIINNNCLNDPHNGSLFERMFSSQLFKNSGCRFCKDHFAECADVSFCDFWNKNEMATEHEGNSCIIVRSEKAHKIIQEMAQENYIKIVRYLTEDEIESGQMHVLKVKKGDPKKLLSYRLFEVAKEFIFRIFGNK